MPQYVHSHAREKTIADLVRQVVFGLGHGMISILGLSVGVASATESTKTVAIAGVVGMLTGLAALVALQFLSARTQGQVHQHMVEEELREFAEHPEVEKEEMRQYYVYAGFSGEEADAFVGRLSLDKDRWLNAHVTHVLGFLPAERVSPARESTVLGLAHLFGATITLLPYLLVASLPTAAYTSVVLASATLFVAGALKTRAAGGWWFESGAEFFALGMLAVVAGYLVGVAVGAIA